MMKNNKKELFGWCMYDWANSVYSLVISTAIFPIYYIAIAPEHVNIFGFSIDKISLRSYAISFSYALIVLFGPLIAGIADGRGMKKQFLMAACYLGSISCMSLFFFTEDRLLFGLSAFVLATFSYALSENIYNSYLPEISTPDKFDELSAKGYTLGYIGSVILLIFSLILIEKADLIGWDKGTATRFGFVMTGIWWAIFGTFTFTRLRKSKTVSEEKIISGFEEIKICAAKILKSSLLRYFLITFLIYDMGLQTVMNVSVDFAAQDLKLESGSMIIALLLIQLVAVGGAYFFAYISEKKGNIIALQIAMMIWIGICTYAYFIHTATEFYILGAFVGWVMGGIQSCSRATYSKLLPEEFKGSASFFSFYSIIDKIAIILGTLTFGAINQLTGSMRYAIIFLIIFFVTGFILLSQFKWDSTKLSTE